MKHNLMPSQSFSFFSFWSLNVIQFNNTKIIKPIIFGSTSVPPKTFPIDDNKNAAKQIYLGALRT